MEWQYFVCLFALYFFLEIVLQKTIDLYICSNSVLNYFLYVQISCSVLILTDITLQTHTLSNLPYSKSIVSVTCAMHLSPSQMIINFTFYTSERSYGADDVGF